MENSIPVEQADRHLMNTGPQSEREVVGCINYNVIAEDGIRGDIGAIKEYLCCPPYNDRVGS